MRIVKDWTVAWRARVRHRFLRKRVGPGRWAEPGRISRYFRAREFRGKRRMAVTKLEIHELPAARGCTYVLPAQDFALALKAGENFTANDMKIALKLGVTEKEIGKLCDAVMKGLAKGTPMVAEEIRATVANGARSVAE